MTREGELIVIEFAGLPGAGKSTTLSTFARNYGDALGVESAFSLEPRYPNFRLFRQMQHIARFALKNPKAALTTLRYWARSTRWSLVGFKEVLRCWILADRIDQRRHRSHGGVVILDQGLLQSVGSMAIPARNPSLQDVTAALKALVKGRIDALIWLECSRAIAEDRRLRRSYGTTVFDGPDQRTARADLERFESAICAARAAASSDFQQFLEIDALASAEQNAKRIADWIAELHWGRMSPQPDASASVSI